MSQFGGLTLDLFYTIIEVRLLHSILRLFKRATPGIILYCPQGAKVEPRSIWYDRPAVLPDAKMVVVVSNAL